MSFSDAVLAVGLGAGLGFVFALMGAGGSIFAVPVLVFLFHKPVSTAMGTSLAMVCAAAIVGTIRHARDGRVVKPVALYFGSAAVVGALIGAKLHPLLDERWALGLFAVMLLGAAARMLWPGKPKELGPIELRASRLLPMGFMLGVVIGLLGVGGGFLIVPMLMWTARLTLPLAIGTSLAVIAASSLSGAIGYAQNGHVDAPMLLATGLGACVGAWWGGAFSARVPQAPLRVGFAIMALLVAARVLWQAMA